MSIFADTSFYVALGYKHDDFHKEAMAFAGNYEGDYITSDYIIVELGNFFSAKKERHLFKILYDQLINHPKTKILPASSALTQGGVSMFMTRMDKQWSLTDCISFSLMEQFGITQAATTDHHFEQAGFEKLITRQDYKG